MTSVAGTYKIEQFMRTFGKKYKKIMKNRKFSC